MEPVQEPMPGDRRNTEEPKFVLHDQHSIYNFTERRNVEKPTNVLESTVHLIKGCLGGGLMGIHEAYAKAGLWTSFISTLLFGVYITYCMHMVVRSAQVLYGRLHLHTLSYPDVAEAAMKVGPFPKWRKYSKIFRYTVDLIICFDLFGSCCVYVIIIAKTIMQLVHNDPNSNEDEVYDLTTLRMYVLMLVIPIMLLCMITSLKYLAPFSFVADVLIVVCVLATVYYAMMNNPPPLSEVKGWKDIMGFFEFMGVVVFAMEGVGVSLPIENNMRDPKKFPIVLVGGMSVVVVFVITVGFFGYWGFQEASQAPVTLNFPRALFPSILKGMMGVMIFFTFALNFWAPFNLCWHYIAKRYPKERHGLWERIYRVVVVILITAVAIAFPNIGNLMGLLGSFCLSTMGFIFPALIEILVEWEVPGLGKYKWRLWKNVLIIALGIVFLISGTYTNGIGLLKTL